MTEVQDWGLEALTVKASNVEEFNWLPTEQVEQLDKLMKHLSLNHYLGAKIVEQSAVEIATQNLKGIVQEVKFDERTKVEITSGDDVPFSAKLQHIKEKPNANGTYNLLVALIENDEIIVNRVEQTTSQTVELFDPLKSLKSDAPNDNKISIEAWYDNVPCLSNGCCTFSGVKYNWCGAKCGSKTPINDADTCCRTHDYCYGSFATYPKRCECDKNLRTCLGYTSDPGSSTMRAAFYLKMLYMGC